MNKNRLWNLLIVAFSGLFAKASFAICPICVLAIGAGIGISHYLGIDDSITGTWVGAFIVALIGWTIQFFNKHNIRFRGRIILTALTWYGMIIIPLYYKGFFNSYFNELFDMDKLALGIIVGSIAFLGTALWYFHLKKKNEGHAYFPMQKVVMPVAVLLIISLIFYFLTK